MKYKYMIAPLLMLAVVYGAVASELSISQSVTGNGKWEMDTNLRTACMTAGGSGDMALATKGILKAEGAYLQSGVDFSGKNGYMTIGSSLIDYGYNLKASDAKSLSIRTKVDTLTADETQDSVIGIYKTYGLTVKAQVNGSLNEDISQGMRMGRPVILSAFRGYSGVWYFNNSIDATEYSNANNEGA